MTRYVGTKLNRVITVRVPLRMDRLILLFVLLCGHKQRMAFGLGAHWCRRLYLPFFLLLHLLGTTPNSQSNSPPPRQLSTCTQAVDEEYHYFSGCESYLQLDEDQILCPCIAARSVEP